MEPHYLPAFDRDLPFVDSDNDREEAIPPSRRLGVRGVIGLGVVASLIIALTALSSRVNLSQATLFHPSHVVGEVETSVNDASPFQSSGGHATVHFAMKWPSVPTWMIDKVWPQMHVEFNEGISAVTASSLSEYTRGLLGGESPFGGPRGAVKIPTGGLISDQLNWGEYVAYSRRQVCYIAANIVAGHIAYDYSGNGLSRLIPQSKCDGNLHGAGFKRSLIGLLAACSVDPTMQGGAHGPMLVVAKGTNDLSRAPPLTGSEAQHAKMEDAGLRACRFKDGSSSNAPIGTIPSTPLSACNPSENVDFMRDGNTMHGQVMIDITAEWIGGYVLSAGGCGGVGAGQDERLMVAMPEVMLLSFFLSEKPSPRDPAGVSLLVPAYIFGARKVFSGFDGTSKDFGPAFNVGKPSINARLPMNSDLVGVQLGGNNVLLSMASPFLGFQSMNQYGGHQLPDARLNRDQNQLSVDGETSFQHQVAAWFNAMSLMSWHTDVQSILTRSVVAAGTGPWGSGVWWGSSQVFFLALWIGQALAAKTWPRPVHLDYYLYSSFTENPSNQCLVHSKNECITCLNACDNEGSPYPGDNNRYCCMEPESWRHSSGLFHGKACIPTTDSWACGNRGLGDVYAKYANATVATLWRDLEPTLRSLDPFRATLFDYLLDR
eukprot:TRINITY_DN25920_c0_g1_i1.p1 TRINITY_DN25920_c0_g1~~TRINITY_DN25920_c0_g1_i1.p1  ORF type:complete len:659 (-),score=58.82 TRINITY_DN25920_c0_g1_i1:16-1992(-)